MGDELERERRKWRAFPRRRPRNVLPPRPGQESVWDYPRPPRLERVPEPLRVELAGEVLAATREGLRVCETSSPPTYYFPPADVRADWLLPGQESSFCEWKGLARYWSARPGAAGPVYPDVAWSYPEPDPGFEPLRGYFAFYSGRMDACYVGDERVQAQAGAFYGGWITERIVGPFKGEPGTEGW